MRRALAIVVALALVVSGVRVWADALDGALLVTSAYVDIDHSVYALHARIEYPMTPAIRNALRDGVSLAFDLEARITRDRRFWFDPVIADVTLRRELVYHSVSDRYVVRDVQGGTQQSFPTLEEALTMLSQVDNWPILVESQLVPGEHYHVSLRAGIRRGRLPASLRALLFWTNDWHRVSGWYTWMLPS
ncbi:MAG TPA: DUF4390 domain-containing protein [Steroidobacteraceae bacterium]|nr:DUF4390 domain-containing protein [Steroidobacteraceae bacterium]